MKNIKLWISFLAGMLAVAIVLGMLCTEIPVSAGAATESALEQQLSDLEDEKAAVDAKIKNLRSKLSANADEIEAIVAQKSLIDQEVNLLYQQIENINEQISVFSLLIADKQAELDQAQRKLDQVNERNKSRIRAMEKRGEVSYWSVIFQAESIVDMLDRVETIRKISEADRLCLEELRQAADEVEQAKTSLETEMASLEQSRQELTQMQNDLEQRRQEADALLAEAVAKGEEFERLLEKSEDQQDVLADKIAKAEAAYEKETKPSQPSGSDGSGSSSGSGSSGSSGSSGGSSGASGGSNTVNGITWLVPCSYTYLSSPFGYRYHPLSGKYKLHKGVDLAAPTGTPIVATRSGYVTTASYEANGAGYYVSLNHGDGYSSIYMHMTRFIVSAGQYVNAGQVIGYVGTTGGSTGPHLHFGISYNGTYVNPADYIKI